MNESQVIVSAISSDKKKKVRKWDNPNPITKTDEDDNLNSEVGNKGKQASGVTKPTLLKASSISEFGFDYDINELEPIYRSIICLGITLDEIKQNTGATVMVKGKYLTAEEKEISKERPLYLHIKGSTQQIVNAAIAKIKSLVTKPLNPANASSDQDINKQQLFVQDKVFVGLDRALTGFNLNQRILGPNGSYLQHIQISTGAKVSLRGRGSGFVESTTSHESNEPLHLLIQHATTFGIHQAKCLSSNLIQTIQREYVKYEKDQALLPPTITPGTASLLAGLQQYQNQGVPPFNPQFQNSFHSQLPQFNNIQPIQNQIPNNPTANNFNQYMSNMSPFIGSQNSNIENTQIQYNGNYNAGFQYSSSSACPVSAPTHIAPVGNSSSSGFNLNVLPIGPPISKIQDIVSVAPVGPPSSKIMDSVATTNVTLNVSSTIESSSTLPVFRLTSFLPLPKIVPEINKKDNVEIYQNNDRDVKSLDDISTSNKILSNDSVSDIRTSSNHLRNFDQVINGLCDTIKDCSDNKESSIGNSGKLEAINKSIATTVSNFKNANTSVLGTPLSNLELPPLEFFANVPPPNMSTEKKKPDANTYYSNFIHPPAVSEVSKYEKNEKVKKTKKRKFVENKEADDEQEQFMHVKKEHASFLHPAQQTCNFIGSRNIVKIDESKMEHTASSRLSVSINDKTFNNPNSCQTTNLYNSSNDGLSVNDVNSTSKSVKNDNERLLMPPPSLVVLPNLKSKSELSTEKKKPKGALSSVAALYGSDDED